MGKKSIIRVISALLALGFVAGCGGMWANQRQRSYSSVVEYLYPEKKPNPEVAAVPRLELPLRVAVAFVPGVSSMSLDEAFRLSLMDSAAKEFEGLPFVREIQRIPSAYLVPKGGFDNVDQLRTMYGTDVVALLSYDQIQHTDEGALSLLYWTIIGAYVIEAEKNDTSTMIDAAVYHIPSRKLLFRAPGVSRVKGTATPVNLSEQLRLDSRKGFEEASADMAANLKKELEAFKVKLKNQPEQYQVVHAPGYKGGGDIGLLYGSLVIFLLVAAVRRGGKAAEA